MEEALIKVEVSLIANSEATEVAQVSEGALDFPTLTISPQRASILQFDFASVLAMRANQFDAARGQSLAQGLRIITPITDESLRSIARTSCSKTRYLHRAQGFLGQGHLRGRGAKESTSQRNTRAVCHHHPLCTFATSGFSHAEPPFLALAKLPSINTSLQLSFPCPSNLERKARQMVLDICGCEFWLRARREE